MITIELTEDEAKAVTAAFSNYKKDVDDLPEDKQYETFKNSIVHMNSVHKKIVVARLEAVANK